MCIEDILGLKRRGNVLTIDPCIPGKWREYSLDYCFGSSVYAIRVLNPQGVSRGVAKIEVNGAICQEIELAAEGGIQQVTVVMGQESTPDF